MNLNFHKSDINFFVRILVFGAIFLVSVEADSAGHKFSTPAVSVNVTRDFSLSISGTGMRRMGPMEIEDNHGTIIWDNVKREIHVMEYIPWKDLGWDLYQAYIIDNKAMRVLWLYCNGDKLQYIYSHSTHGFPLKRERAGGTCQRQMKQTSWEFSHPPLSITLSRAVQGITVQSPFLRLEKDGKGWVKLRQGIFQFIAYDQVDCSEDCGAHPGWHEVHLLMHDPVEQRIMFGILYLFYRQNYMTIAHTLSFPENKPMLDYTPLLFGKWKLKELESHK